MDFIVDLLTNYVLVSAFCGWLIAQILKSLTGVFKLKKFTINEFFFGTGGMPSSHTAAVSALACACILKHGVGSAEFAISAVLTLVVMRDAMGMRRQVGEHAKALNIIIQEISEAKNDPRLMQKAFGELAGHSPLQVFAGLLVGIIVPFLVGLIPVFNMFL